MRADFGSWSTCESYLAHLTSSFRGSKLSSLFTGAIGITTKAASERRCRNGMQAFGSKSSKQTVVAMRGMWQPFLL